MASIDFILDRNAMASGVLYFRNIVLIRSKWYKNSDYHAFLFLWGQGLDSVVFLQHG